MPVYAPNVLPSTSPNFSKPHLLYNKHHRPRYVCAARLIMTESHILPADVSFSSMFRLRGHFQEASKLATPYYPETLGMIIVVNAPSFFPTIWSWIKVWTIPPSQQKHELTTFRAGLTKARVIRSISWAGTPRRLCSL